MPESNRQAIAERLALFQFVEWRPPAVAGVDRVLDYHLTAVRTTLDLNGIADPREFAARLKKAA